VPALPGRGPDRKRARGQVRGPARNQVRIDCEDDSEKVREFVESYGIEGPATYGLSLGETYRVSGYPTVYVLNGEGEIVAAHWGEVTGEVLRSPFEEALWVSPAGARLAIDSGGARG
jgi:hypothetical protein